MCTVGKAQSLRAFRRTLTLLDTPQSAFRPIVFGLLLLLFWFVFFKVAKTTPHAVKFQYLLSGSFLTLSAEKHP